MILFYLKGIAFLLTDEGKEYESIFKALRIRNLFTSPKEILEVVQDNIIPQAWYASYITENWLSLLSFESSANIGPSLETVSDEQFNANAMRVSKIIKGPDIHR